MQNKPVEIIRDTLKHLDRVRPEGKGWRTRCPNPDHEDLHPSFFLYPGGAGRCFSRCDRYWPPVLASQFCNGRLYRDLYNLSGLKV